MFDKGILSVKIADMIKQMIIEKELKLGDKLPNEIELSEELQVSRSTVREAIKILVSTNVLEVHRGKGTFVSMNPGISKDPLGVSFMDKEDIIEYFYEVRRIIEPEIAALAAKRATKDNISELEGAYKLIYDDIMSEENHTENDILFHNIIAKSSKNPIFNRIVPIINEGILEGYSETKDIPESADRVLHYHEKILNAIKNKDSEAARIYMDDHIAYGIKQITKKGIKTVKNS